MKLLNKLVYSPLITPLLFAVFPILSLWATNFSRMDAQDVIRPLLEAILAALVIYFILKLVLKDSAKAGLLSTLLLFLYFSYGHIFAMIRGIPDLGLTRNRIMGPLWLLALLAGGYLIVRFGKKISGLIPLLNYTGLALLVLAGFQLGYARYHELSVSVQTVQASSIEGNAFDLSNAGNKDAYPDIYLIILDSYARPDSLLESFNYDDTQFEQALIQMGFTLPRCSMSNYAYTAFSMSSMLNMNYLEAFYPKIDPQQKNVDLDWAAFTKYIRYSQVRKNLSDLGYKTVSFESDYPLVEIPNADIFFPSQSSTKALLDLLDPTDFDDELSQTTVLKIIEDRKTVSPWLSGQLDSLDVSVQDLVAWLKSRLYVTNNKKYDRVLSSFSQLEGLGKVPGPKFVYLHSTALHPKYVFGPNGEYKLSDTKQGYADTLAYLNKRMLEILPILIRDSKVPPIIILMGDHGVSPGTDTRLDNFSAFYMPGEGAGQIYPSLTPVNIFRIIFNSYFNGNYQLLPDKSYNFDNGLLFNFRQIAPSCPK